MPTERRPAAHYELGRRGQRPRGIVLHTNVGSFGSTASWFANPDSGVSAHYLVGLDGRVAQFVGEEDTAFHVGRVADPTTSLWDGHDPNPYTVGIEFEDGGDPHGVERTDRQYRAGGRLVRRIALRHGIPLDRAHVVGHSELFAHKDCPGNLDIERILELARVPFVVCLLPARNAEDDIPDFLESAGGACDAVIALDDGSTDGTPDLLAASSLVEILLRNPERRSYAGWDDAENRNRLLEAAAELEPDWILSLDADERIDPGDAEALRAFLRTDAIESCAYGLQHFRSWGGDRYDPRHTWVYRLFAWRPGQRFPARRLHFNPIPTDVPRAAWIRTSLRVRHLGADSEERLEARLAKYREADPARSWPTDFGRLSERPHGTLPLWEPRARALPVLSGAARNPSPPGRRARLVCLLPARNAAADLPGWFESVGRFADAVVALDDGSTDSTRELLQLEPQVKRLITSPRRESYAGWDDAQNRARLLDAAAELEPDWILSLDADERIDPEDAAALRTFVDEEALRDVAYGFRVCRMVGDEHHFDLDSFWAYRLFAYAPGQRFPTERLHFVPVPTAIDRRSFVQTTLRIQHLGGLTPERRRARFSKYAQADPGNEFQPDYSNLLEASSHARVWDPRPPGLPVVSGASAVEVELEGPALSAVVISRNDEDRIEAVVRAVVEQDCPEPFEVIVVVSGTDRTAAIVRSTFPQVRLVDLGHAALPGRARNAGLRLARGEFVSFPGSHVELPPGSLAARLRAHQQGHAMVTGTTLNGTTTRAGWASYFLDHSSVLPNRPSGHLSGPPAHCSYIRDHLLAVGGFPEDMRAGEDTVVNVELHRRGLGAYRAREVAIIHHSRCSSPVRLIRHHFQRGRGMGRILLDENRERGAVLRRAAGPYGTRYLQRRLGVTRSNVERWGGELRAEYRRSRALVAAGATAALAGIWVELLRPARGKSRTLLARGEPGTPVGPAPVRERPIPVRERFPTPIELNAYVVPSLLPRGGRAESEAALAIDGLTYVSPFAHRALADGSIVSPDDSHVRALAGAAGAGALLVLANSGADGAFDTEAARTLLARADLQERLLDEADRIAAERGYRGLSLDFERLRAEDRDGYRAFLERAAERQRTAGGLLVTAVAAKHHAEHDGPEQAGHDLRVHGELADRVVVMAYERSGSSGAPAPVAPLPEVREAVRCALSEIPRGKLLLGVPLFGYDWCLPSESNGRARRLGLDEARELAESRGAAIEYDSLRESAHFRYSDDDGREHVVWFEDERSLLAKFDLVRAWGLRGVSFWRLPGGGELPWRLVRDLFLVAGEEDAERVSAA